jgi:hypothetical protein
MTRRLLLLIAGAICAAMLAVTPALAYHVRVTIRVEGATKTVMPQKSVTTLGRNVIVTGDQDPSHGCSGESGLGVLELATHGDWRGTYFSGLRWSVGEILGAKPKGFYEIWINNRQATVGLCDYVPKRKDEILIFDQTCTFDLQLQGCPNPVLPLGLIVPKTVRVGQRFTVQVVRFGVTGQATPVRGAQVLAGKVKFKKTDAQGRTKVLARKAAKVVFDATFPGAVRSGPETVTIKP